MPCSEAFSLLVVVESGESVSGCFPLQLVLAFQTFEGLMNDK